MEKNSFENVNSYRIKVGSTLGFERNVTDEN